MSQTQPKTITSVLVKDPHRMQFLPNLFGRYFMSGEATVYSFMEQICKSYSAGMWNFYALDNGGGYLALDEDDEMQIIMPFGNYFDESLSADAAGIVATLCALNALACKHADGQLGEQYWLLRDYISYHPERNAIHRAID